MKTLAVFDKKDYDLATPRTISNSVRAIISHGDTIALCYIAKWAAYAFPGGHIEEGETHLEALIRETREEAGLIVIPQSVREFGSTLEIRKDLFVDGIYEQHNFYYSCYVDDVRLERMLSENEKDAGYQFEFVSLDQAIATNEAAIQAGKEWIEIETYVMRLVRDGVSY